MKKIYFLAAALCIALTLIGCETVKGIGRDIEGASSTVQHSFSR